MRKNKTKGGTFSVYIRDVKVWKEFKKFCKNENMSASLYLEVVIRNAIGKKEEVK